MPTFYVGQYRLVLRDIFENVAGLAVEGAAEGFQSRETDCLGLACLKNGKIRGGNTDFLSQFSARHLPASQHYIYVNCNRHNRYSVASPSAGDCGFTSAPLR